jgi:hypothetical protein
MLASLTDESQSDELIPVELSTSRAIFIRASPRGISLGVLSIKSGATVFVVTGGSVNGSFGLILSGPCELEDGPEELDEPSEN